MLLPARRFVLGKGEPSRAFLICNGSGVVGAAAPLGVTTVLFSSTGTLGVTRCFLVIGLPDDVELPVEAAELSVLVPCACAEPAAQKIAAQAILAKSSLLIEMLLVR
jgi:hypothetical protein